ncbi:MAG TPA: hypothetical protein VFL04_08515 [Rectinemataceae bacterium]|nr:hypothetical protein [Rectinemataceae bacterium]
MKIVRAVLTVLAVVLVLASCSSMAQGAVSGALNSLGSGGGLAPSGGGAMAAGSGTASVDFQSGEVLSSDDTGKMMDAAYDLSKILTPASPATKNQAEAVFIDGGKKQWVNYVVNSRKASKSDFTVGATVFILAGWQGHDEISADSYRKGTWHLATITSVEDLFKNRVEVGGNSFNINYIRIPTDPIR